MEEICIVHALLVRVQNVTASLGRAWQFLKPNNTATI